MPLIPDDLVDRIKREISIVLLVTRSGVELRRVGENLVGRCNRHQDDTPSLVVGEEKGLFHCMGACRRGGSVIDWVMWQEDLGFHDASRKLIEEFFPEEGSKLFSGPRPSRRFRAEPLTCPIDEEAEGQELDRQVVAYYHQAGKESPELRAYLEKRGIGDVELVERFGIGLANRTLGMRLSPKLRKRCQDRGWIREKTGHEHLNGSLTLAISGPDGEVLNCYGRKLRSDLRAGTPDHLYLPRPLRGLLNREAFTASSEIVLCEAPIDFLSAWCHGFRASTCTWGAEGFTEDHFEAFVSHGIERCLIAFDRDEAGDEGAKMVAARLSAAGIACYRILFPKGMDLNDVVVKMHPAEKTLEVFFRSAEWMAGGNGARSVVLGTGRSSLPPNGKRVPAGEVLAVASHIPAPLLCNEAAESPGPPLSAAPSEATATEPAATEAAAAAATGPGEATKGESSSPATEEGSLMRAAEASTPLSSPATSEPLVSSTDDEAVFLFGDRRYRVRGMKRNTAFGILKLNVLLTREGVSFEGTPFSGLHADTFDVYLARARQLFERQAAQEIGVKEEVVKRDLGAMLKRLEELQAETLRKAHEPKAKEVVLTPEETAEALELWKSPNLLDRIVSDMTTCGLVGEAVNKLVTYVAGVSRLLDRPLAVIIQSSSAAGKTSLMDAVLSLMPEEAREKYTAVSGKSLFYFDDATSLRHKILAIVEEEGAEKATYPLKLLQSEGELVMASTGKDPHSGKLVTQVYKVEGPVMIILTTTAIELDPELENRCLRLTVDESREQTRLIHELQRMRQTREGLVARKERGRIQRLHQNAQRLLRPLSILNPYVSGLTFVDDQTRTRRDHDKYLTLIEAIALMHQHQRPLVEVVVEGEIIECVEVELSDIEVANRIAGEVLGRTLDELPPQTRRFLTQLHGRVRTICEESGVEQCDLRFTRRDARLWTGGRSTQVFTHLARLVELEYALVHRGSRGQSFVYELLYRGEGLDGQPFVLGLVDVEKLRQKSYDPNLSDLSEGDSGSIRAGFGGDSGPSRSGSIEAGAAPDAGLSEPDSRTLSNARLPGAGKLGSYRSGSRRRNSGIALNLLRFPPAPLPVARPRPGATATAAAATSVAVATVAAAAGEPAL